MGNLRLRFSVYLLDGFSINDGYRDKADDILLVPSLMTQLHQVEYLPKSPLIPHWPCCVWPPFRYHSSFDDSARIPPLMRKLRLLVCGGFVLPLKSATRKREIQPMEEIFFTFAT